MTDERPWWEGKSEDEIQAHLNEVRAVLDLRAAIEEIEHLEKVSDATPVHSWPPMPCTEHPSFAEQAASVRDLMTEGCYTVYLAHPRPSLATFIFPTQEEDVRVVRRSEIVLQVRKVWTGLVPHVGDPYAYMWRVAVDDANRWVAGESWVEHVPRDPRYEERP